MQLEDDGSIGLHGRGSDTRLLPSFGGHNPVHSCRQFAIQPVSTSSTVVISRSSLPQNRLVGRRAERKRLVPIARDVTGRRSKKTGQQLNTDAVDKQSSEPVDHRSLRHHQIPVFIWWRR